MFRSLKMEANGLGELTLRPEMPAEVDELARVCPYRLPAGVIHGYQWTKPPEEGGHLILFARKDPAWQPPPLEPPALGKAGYLPVPTREQLEEWSMADLVTRAAELGVEHKSGEKKITLVMKIIPAWTKANAELDVKAKGNAVT